MKLGAIKKPRILGECGGGVGGVRQYKSEICQCFILAVRISSVKRGSGNDEGGGREDSKDERKRR